MTIYSFENSITINNYNNTTLYYSLRGEEVYNDGTTYFESPEIMIAPGDVVHFDNPSEVPGLEYLDSTATFIFIKGYSPDCPGADMSVGCDGNTYSMSFTGPNPSICSPLIYGIMYSGGCGQNSVVMIF